MSPMCHVIVRMTLWQNKLDMETPHRTADIEHTETDRMKYNNTITSTCTMSHSYSINILILHTHIYINIFLYGSHSSYHLHYN